MMVKLKHKCPQKPLILPAALHLETLAQFQVIIFCNNVDLETMLLKIIFVIYIYIVVFMIPQRTFYIHGTVPFFE